MQPKPGTASFTRQQAPLGLGHAVWCARDLVGDEPFALLLPDMIMQAEKGCLAEMVRLYEETGGNIVSVEQCDPQETDKYGIVGRGEDVGSGFRLDGMVEKPKPADAPSNYYISGRYILQPQVFDILETQEKGAGNEIQLTDGMLKLADQQDFYAYPFHGRTFDCGSKEGFIEANVAFALWRPDIRDKVIGNMERLMDTVKPKDAAKAAE